MNVGKHLDELNTKSDGIEKQVDDMRKKVNVLNEEWIEGVIHRLIKKDNGLKLKILGSGNLKEEAKKSKFIKSRSKQSKPTLPSKKELAVLHKRTPPPPSTQMTPTTPNFSVFSPDLPPPGPIIPKPNLTPNVNLEYIPPPIAP